MTTEGHYLQGGPSLLDGTHEGLLPGHVPMCGDLQLFLKLLVALHLLLQILQDCTMLVLHISTALTFRFSQFSKTATNLTTTANTTSHLNARKGSRQEASQASAWKKSLPTDDSRSNSAGVHVRFLGNNTAEHQ